MNHDNSQGMSKHMLIMLVCCLVPIVLIVAVSLFGFSLGSLTPLLPFALVLLCPLMMIFMMRSMGHDQGHLGEHDMADHHHNANVNPGTSRPAITPKATASVPTSGQEQPHG